MIHELNYKCKLMHGKQREKIEQWSKVFIVFLFELLVIFKFFNWLTET